MWCPVGVVEPEPARDSKLALRLRYGLLLRLDGVIELVGVAVEAAVSTGGVGFAALDDEPEASLLSLTVLAAEKRLGSRFESAVASVCPEDLSTSLA